MSKKKYTSHLFPQSTYRKSSSDILSSKKSIQSLDLTLPNLRQLTHSIKTQISQLIKDLYLRIMKMVLPEKKRHSDQCLSTIYNKMALNDDADTKSPPDTRSIQLIWPSIEHQILNNIKSIILDHYISDILLFFSQKIAYIVRQYTKYLPKHVKESEIDDLTTISQLEFIETFKAWNPNKSQDIWPLAYSRITGAMKDHIRYITKSDPSRLYDWITDAAYLYTWQQNETDFASKIETGAQLDAAMSVLTPREKQIVITYTKKDLTFQQIGKHLKISESQISRIYNNAIKKIKRQIEKDG